VQEVLIGMIVGGFGAVGWGFWLVIETKSSSKPPLLLPLNNKRIARGWSLVFAGCVTWSVMLFLWPLFVLAAEPLLNRIESGACALSAIVPLLKWLSTPVVAKPTKEKSAG
jgi:hypothetical protein